ncbi:hypothetical protein R5W24_005277 [Gemmata sp. JC717]|uniref:hypothetical protein n=1 Tax=Gemmata algarum TaxID=2975278 RepID=UPI0021BA4D1C|nr:hypothetical protein [Gemmata algarum]MDY3556114.1 hypothetical protein [Gemmata algarum]
MSRKPAAKKAKQPRKAKSLKAYIVVREVSAVNTSYTEPDLVFASKKAAEEHAERLNRELRAHTNPFAGDTDPGFLMSDEDELFKLLKTFGVPEPKAPKVGYVKWDQWWARVVGELTEGQRDAVWAAFDEFEWYEVRETTLED